MKNCLFYFLRKLKNSVVDFFAQKKGFQARKCFNRIFINTFALKIFSFRRKKSGTEENFYATNKHLTKRFNFFQKLIFSFTRFRFFHLRFVGKETWWKLTKLFDLSEGRSFEGGRSWMKEKLEVLLQIIIFMNFHELYEFFLLTVFAQE